MFLCSERKAALPPRAPGKSPARSLCHQIHSKRTQSPPAGTEQGEKSPPNCQKPHKSACVPSHGKDKSYSNAVYFNYWLPN